MRETRTAQTSVFVFYSQHERSTFFRNLSERLDRYPQLHRLIEPDLRKPGTRETGRKGLSVENAFRCVLLKQITRVSYPFCRRIHPAIAALCDWRAMAFPANRRCVPSSGVCVRRP